MTETQIRIATAFVAGLAVGGGTTYFVVKHKLEKKYKALADEEIASVKETFERRSKERTDEEFVSEVTDKDMFDPEEAVRANEELFDSPEVLTEKEAIQYNKIKSNYVPKDSPLMERRDNKVPYLITAEEFMEDGIHEDEKVSLTFYEDGGTVADEDDSIMDDVDAILGKENLNHFGDNPDDPDIIHIRNEARGVDYEIVRNQLSYSEVVLGIKDWDAEDVKQKRRPKKMRNNE